MHYTPAVAALPVWTPWPFPSLPGAIRALSPLERGFWGDSPALRVMTGAICGLRGQVPSSVGTFWHVSLIGLLLGWVRIGITARLL